MSARQDQRSPSQEQALQRSVASEPPVEIDRPQVSEVETYAGGLPAVTSAMGHALEKMGAVRTVRTLARVNQKNGFDCPSCAWPDDDGDRDMAAFCENGAKAVADEAMTARIGPAFFAENSVADLSARSDHWLNAQGRLTHPMVLRPGATSYEPVTWDEAFATIARELNRLESPNEAVFYTSGRTSNEAAFLYQLFVRQFGTNNLPDCSNMCHESSGLALRETVGIGKGTVTLEDFEHTDLVLVIGQNPGTNHPRMLTALQKAKQRGAKIISVNPLPEAGLERFKHPQSVRDMLGHGTKLADLHLPAKINGDMAVLQGIAKEVLAAGAIDGDFVAAKTEGFLAWKRAMETVSWDAIVADCGLEREPIALAARMVMGAPRMIVTWAMGLTQSPNAVATIQEIVNLVLARGSIGKQGAGLCPVRGHSNVQGDRTMGIWEKPSKDLLDALARELSFEPPREHGFDTVESIRAMHDGRVKVFFGMGGNFLSATPDTRFTAEALARTRLTVHVSTKLNRSHLVTGRAAIILPCLGRTELDEQATGPQFVTCENSMGVVHMSRGRLPPASKDLLSEPAIVARLAKATLGDKSTVDWDAMVASYAAIREVIARVIPGCQDYEARVQHPGGFYLPNGPRQGTFTTKSGRAHFTVHAIPERRVGPRQLVMMTIRSHDQFNTTIYGLDDRYRGIRGGRRVILMNPEDLRARSLAGGDLVDITSHFRGEERTAERFAVVPFPIPRGNCATYFPEANPLVPVDSVAAGSNTPTSKYVIVSLERSPETSHYRLKEPATRSAPQ
jgi:molybdopterin-dependent oxidoreductase alpha subunit